MKISKEQFRQVLVSDMRIGVMIAIVWSMLTPYAQVLKGLFTPETVALFMVLSALAMETLKFIGKRTTFRSSTLVMIILDVTFLFVMLYCLMIDVSDKTLIIVMTISFIPYGVLGKNAGIKFKAEIGSRYKKYMVERISENLAVWENRGTVAATVVAGTISSLSGEPRMILVAFLVLSSIQSVWTIIAFNKYYAPFK